MEIRPCQMVLKATKQNQKENMAKQHWAGVEVCGADSEAVLDAETQSDLQDVRERSPEGTVGAEAREWERYWYVWGTRAIAE